MDLALRVRKIWRDLMDVVHISRNWCDGSEEPNSAHPISKRAWELVVSEQSLTARAFHYRVMRAVIPRNDESDRIETSYAVWKDVVRYLVAPAWLPSEDYRLQIQR